MNKEFSDISIINDEIDNYNRNLVIMPVFISKGLEFDSVIIINNFSNDKYLYYIAVTRAQHELIVFNSTK